MQKTECIMLSLILIFVSACMDSKQKIQDRLLNSSNFDKSIIYANKAHELGIEGIPIFLKVISASINDQYNVATYGKLMLCVNHLHEMAKKGIRSEESVPILFNLLENQISITDSLITAETLEIITGIEVGYDQNFIETYNTSDEPRRKEMISKWKSLSNSKVPER